MMSSRPSQQAHRSSAVASAARIAGIFFLVCVLWIIFSDRLLLKLVSADTLERITHFQMIKGIGFLFAVAVLLFFMIRRSLEKLRQTMESAESTSEQLRLLVDGATDYSMLMLDPTGKVISWNRGAQRLHDYRAEEILGKHFSIFHPPEDVQAGKPERALKVATEHGRFEDEGWRLRLDGSRYWAHVVITSLRDQSGQLRGFSKITRDLSELKQIESLLQEQHQQQKAAQAPPNPANHTPPALV